MLFQSLWARDSDRGDIDPISIDYVELSNNSALNRLHYSNNNDGVERLEGMLLSLRKRKNSWCYYDIAEMNAGVRADGSVWSASRTIQTAIRIEDSCPLNNPDGDQTTIIEHELDIDEFIKLNESLERLIGSGQLRNGIEEESDNFLTERELLSMLALIEVTSVGFKSEHVSQELRVIVEWISLNDGYEIGSVEVHQRISGI